MDKLQHDTLRPACILKGVVKKSEKETEVLFKSKELRSGWIKIPSSMIHSAVVLNKIPYTEEEMTLVKLILKVPSTPEGAVMFELLSSALHQKECAEHVQKECVGHTHDKCRSRKEKHDQEHFPHRA